MPETDTNETDARLSVQATFPFSAESTALVTGPFFVWANHLDIFAGTATTNEPGHVQGKCIQIAEIMDDYERDDAETDDDGDYLDGRKFSPQAVAITKLLASSAKFREALLTISTSATIPTTARRPSGWR